MTFFEKEFSMEKLNELIIWFIDLKKVTGPISEDFKNFCDRAILTLSAAKGLIIQYEKEAAAKKAAQQAERKPAAACGPSAAQDFSAFIQELIQKFGKDKPE